MLLKDKVAVITGGASPRGIGKATARLFAEHGAKVAILDLDAAAAAAAAKDLGAGHMGLACNVTRKADCDRAASEVVKHFGTIDVLVNNAGVIQEKGFLDLTEHDWDLMIDTDLKSVFLCCRAVLPGMLARKGGTVINVASELGFLGRERYVSYCAAKAGVIGLTKALARELAPTIRVNGIAPGPINTPMLSPENMSPEWLKKEIAIPAGRIGEPDEIASTALFLASEHARFYYGQMLSPNGGAWMA